MEILWSDKQWVSDFCLTTNEHFLTISLQELAAFGEMLLMLMISGLYWTNSRSCFFYSSSSLPQQSVGKTHYFDSNQPVLWDAANTNFIVLGLTRPGANLRSVTFEVSTLTISPRKRLPIQWSVSINRSEKKGRS
jgi:hypothetical protein